MALKGMPKPKVHVMKLGSSMGADIAAQVLAGKK